VWKEVEKEAAGLAADLQSQDLNTPLQSLTPPSQAIGASVARQPSPSSQLATGHLASMALVEKAFKRSALAVLLGLQPPSFPPFSSSSLPPSMCMCACAC
jgi:hypothetical protein